MPETPEIPENPQNLAETPSPPASPGPTTPVFSENPSQNNVSQPFSLQTPENTQISPEIPLLEGEIVEETEPPGEPLPAVFKARRYNMFTEAITVEKIDNFLCRLEQTGLLGQSAQEAGLAFITVKRLQRDDEDFAAYMEDAMNTYRESLEREAHRRAVDGWDEPVFSQKLGCEIGVIRKYDPRLLELMLKRHIPAYREKFEGEIKVTGGVLVAPVTQATVAAWAQQHGGEKIQLLSEEGKA